MPEPAEDAWLFPGDYITGDMTYCGSCGTFDHDDCGLPRQKPKTLVTVHSFRGGGPTGYAFEQPYGSKGFTIPTYWLSSKRLRLFELDRIDMRIFPRNVNWSNEEGRVPPALVIMAKSSIAGGTPFEAFSCGGLIGVDHKEWTVNGNTWLAAQTEPPYGGPQFAVFGSLHERHFVNGAEIDGLRLDDKTVSYTTRSGTPHRFEFNWLFDYTSGETLRQPAAV